MGVLQIMDRNSITGLGRWRLMWALFALALLLGAPAAAGTFGRVIPIGGQASDLAVDEARGVIYVAHFAAKRIEVVSLATGRLGAPMAVPGQPGSIDISPNGKYLIAGHYGNFADPLSPENGLTLITLATREQRSLELDAPVLGTAFGSDGLAFVVTNKAFYIANPESGEVRQLDTVQAVAAQTLPVDVGKSPPDITEASVAVSRDRNTIYVLGGHNETQTFKFDVLTQRVLPGGVVLASGVLGPRVVSINHNGTRTFVGWVMVDEKGNFSNFYRETSNQFSIGTTAFDDRRNLVYAQMPKAARESPTLMISDADNLAVQERMQLAENTAGKSILSSDGNIMYTISASGITIFPIGAINSQPRLVAAPEDLVFRGNFCNRAMGTQILTLTNPGGGAVDFSLSTTTRGITFSRSSGTTPATIAVTVDPNAFTQSKGTVTAEIEIKSAAAVNVIPNVRVLINNREPDQRGTIVNVPGQLTDIVADPLHDRFFILRQDKNQVLVFDGSALRQFATLKTYNSPTSLAITQDGKYLLIGHDSSQVAAVYELETLRQLPYIATGASEGTVAHHIAAAAHGIFAAATDYKGKGRILKLDLETRTSTQLESLGPYNNDIAADTVAVASPGGATIFFPSASGNILLYNDSAELFSASRKDFESLGGGYGASPDGNYWVGNQLFNASAVPAGTYDDAQGMTAGVGFFGNAGYRVTTTTESAPGGLHRLAGPDRYLELVDPARTVEASKGGLAGATFSRTVAVLSNTRTIIVLSASGFMAVPTNYPTLTRTPVIDKVVSAADLSANVAAGGLISVFGSGLAETSIAAPGVPIPSVLGESCLMGGDKPAPLLFVSPNQVNAQLPYASLGEVSLVLKTPGGVSDPFKVNGLIAAPSLFVASLGAAGTTPTIYRDSNKQLVTLSNPVHRGDSLTMYLTGLGQTTPEAVEGQPAPNDPAAVTTVIPTIKLGGVELILDFAGLTPGSAGIYQINARVPFAVPLGFRMPLEIQQGRTGVPGVSSVRVVD
jgi:uncharacterized protein (TIGR03437 family)